MGVPWGPALDAIRIGLRFRIDLVKEACRCRCRAHADEDGCRRIIKKHLGPVQVTRRVQVDVPGKHFPTLQSAEQAALYKGTAVEFSEKHASANSAATAPRHRSLAGRVWPPTWPPADTCNKSD